MKKKAIIAIVSLLTFGQGAWAQSTPSGSWSDNKAASFSTTGTNSITIKSEAELALLAYNVNNGTSYADYTITLDKNLDLSAHYWVPIGMETYNDNSTLTDAKAFKGTFDGGNHSVSGVYVNYPGVGGVGLFGFLYAPAIVRNIKLTSGIIIGNFCVGAIAGEYGGTTNHKDYGIYDCEVGDVTVTAVTAVSENSLGCYAGGIIGDLAQATAERCTSAATVVGEDYVGGIAGHISKSGTYVGTLTNCYFTSNTLPIGGNEATYVGKIVGLNGDLDDDNNLITGSLGSLNITLLNDDKEATVKNATRISNYNGQTATVTLSGRTLFKDGYWNTLCLPFNVSTTTGLLSGNNVKAMTLNTSTSNLTGSTLTLNFSEATSITAGTPFIIKWETSTNLTYLEFTGVTINKEPKNASVGEHVTFTGTYSPVVIDESGDNTKLYLGLGKKQNQDVNALFYPNAAMTIGAFRAYFQLLNGITASNPEQGGVGGSGARDFVLNFSDGETT